MSAEALRGAVQTSSLIHLICFVFFAPFFSSCVSLCLYTHIIRLGMWVCVGSVECAPSCVFDHYFFLFVLVSLLPFFVLFVCRRVSLACVLSFFGHLSGRKREHSVTDDRFTFVWSRVCVYYTCMSSPTPLPWLVFLWSKFCASLEFVFCTTYIRGTGGTADETHTHTHTPTYMQWPFFVDRIVSPYPLCEIFILIFIFV